MVHIDENACQQNQCDLQSIAFEKPEGNKDGHQKMDTIMGHMPKHGTNPRVGASGR